MEHCWRKCVISGGLWNLTASPTSYCLKFLVCVKTWPPSLVAFHASPNTILFPFRTLNKHFVYNLFGAMVFYYSSKKSLIQGLSELGCSLSCWNWPASKPLGSACSLSQQAQSRFTAECHSAKLLETQVHMFVPHVCVPTEPSPQTSIPKIANNQSHVF